MKNEIYKRLLSSILLIPLALFFIIKGSFFLIFFLIICFFITAYEWHMMTKKIKFSLIGYIVFIFSFYSVFEIRNNLPGEYFYILLVTIICVATDIGGYLFGKTFKGPKLTKISPNKTYSGMFGGFFLSLIFTHIYINNINFAQVKIKTSIEFFLIVLLISAISQLGDIIISYFKRLSKIKNTGKIIPGHGGLLDRIDGMIFAFPFSYLIFYSELIIWKKKIAILGSTGSIGKTLINIIKKDKKNFDIILLTSNKNYKDLLKQAYLFNVKNLIITNPVIFNLVKRKKLKKKINI